MKKVLVLAPQSHMDLMFDAMLSAQLHAEFEVWQNPQPRHLAPQEVADKLGDCDAVITGWGASPFPRALVESAPKLQIVAHTAGSPRGLFDDATVAQVLVPRGISIYSGAGGMASNVAEATVGMMILATRRWPLQAGYFREKVQSGATQTQIPARNARFLSGARVGIVSASQVARQVLPFLQAFGCTVLIYDPFLSPEAAQSLGAQLSSLDEMFSTCDIVSLHAPDLPATRGLITPNLLAKLRDGATFINTSRGAVVDHEALLNECRSGRIFAALDVTEPEPLPPTSPFWTEPNLLLLPHTAGQGRAGYQKIGGGALQALRDGLAGRPIEGGVPLDRWEAVA